MQTAHSTASRTTWVLRPMPGVLGRLLLAASLATGGACISQDSDPHALADDAQAIVGGAAARITANPWQVAVVSGDLAGSVAFCGGSILNKDWVLTAQHCVARSDSQVTIIAGSSTLQGAFETGSKAQVRTADVFALYPGYQDGGLGPESDFALLHLASPLNLSGTQAKKIEMVTPDEVTAGATAPGVAARVSGWGVTSYNGTQPNVLRSVDLKLVSNEEAAQIIGAPIPASALPAFANGKDSCQGDSGGPLSAAVNGKRKLIGVVSWGIGCGGLAPGIYARVSWAHPWLTRRATGTLTSLERLSNQAGATGAMSSHAITVPAGMVSLSVAASGGTGDADLYVRRGAAPTAETFDCRPARTNNWEFCTFNLPAAGTWYVGLRGQAAYSGVSLYAAVVKPPPGP
jgi:secreted trypsin-like serine protease